jgi:lysophospholipase L1-like esterase
MAAFVAGCGSGCGCNGDHAKPPEKPRDPAAKVDEQGVPIQEPPVIEAKTVPAAPRSYLDAPPGTLDALNAALAQAERGDPTGRVAMVFFGDSHTAGDSMTSRLRSTFQTRFGDAGRGLVAAGRPPTRHYYQRDVHYGATGFWKAAVGGHKDPEPYGIVGLRVYGEKKGSQLWVETCGDCRAGTSVGQFEIMFQAAPGHGLIRYRIDEGIWQVLATKTAPIEPPHPARFVVPVPDGRHKLTLEHGGGGPVDLFGVALERQKPGVIVDSLGVVGRRLASLRSWDWSVIGEQLATRDPRLVVLQYGTNEADDPDNDLDVLARNYDETIARIRAAAPTAAILVLGPPDMGMREAGKSCDKPKKKPGLSRKPPPSPQPTPPGAPEEESLRPECEWHTPTALREIIAVEHAAAVRNHVAFFDTLAAMGGSERMEEWVTADPKLAYKDHVHFTDAGYQKWADELSGALLGDYERWRRTQNLPPSQQISHAPTAPATQ